MTPCAFTGVEVGESGPLFWCTAHDAWQGDCAEPKVPDSDSRWQNGYQDGSIDADLRMTHRGYLDGWRTGYSGTAQCGADEASAALVAAMMRANDQPGWPMDGKETLDLMGDLATMASVEAAGALLRQAHEDHPDLCPLDMVRQIEDLVVEFKDKVKPHVEATQKAIWTRDRFRRDMVRLGKRFRP